MTDGRVIGGYLSVSWTSNSGYVDDTNAFLYDGEQKYSAQHGYWGAGKYASYMSSSYYPTFGGGHDFYIGGQTLYMNAYSFVLPDRSAPFKRKGWGAPISANLRDIEVYSVDAKIFPRTNPPDYARRLRIMPVGENITASMEKCAQMCNDTDKCGGFVYTKASAGGGDGKCEMKDRDKMYPVGVRVADPSKQLMLKVPMINAGFGDDACRVNNGKYTQIDTARYAHYPDTGAMTSGFKCNMSDIIPKEGTQTAPSTTGILAATDKQIGSTTQKINEYRAQTTASESFTTLREGLVSVVDASKNYLSTMQDVSNNLLKIANAKYQRERLLAMTEETNNLLMAESYKFILWSILAILAVLALLKIKEMFGQDDADSGGDSGGDGGGGILATILGWFGVLKSSTNTSDIADRTEDVKAALSSAGEQLKETGEQLAAGITEGADNLVASANQAMEGAVEGAKGIANKVSETATDAVNKVGDAVASAATSAAPAAASGSTSGSGSAVKTGGSKRRK
jgi:hypothetical protein